MIILYYDAGIIRLLFELIRLFGDLGRWVSGVGEVEGRWYFYAWKILLTKI